LLAVVTFGTARKRLGGVAARPGLSSRNFVGQKVKGQGHTRPKTDLEA